MTIFEEPSRKPLPQPDVDDFKYNTFKAATSLIPGANALLELISEPPIAARRDTWLGDLARTLHDLETKVDSFRIDSLENSEQFLSALLQALPAAIRTHHESKREALRNAIANIALGKWPQDDLQAAFISLIDRFTPAHLFLLRFFQDPKRYGVPFDPDERKQLGRSPVLSVIRSAFPDIGMRFGMGGEPNASLEQFLTLLIQDLHAARFTAITKAMDLKPLYERWTTHLGDEFLRFIALEQPDVTKPPNP